MPNKETETYFEYIENIGFRKCKIDDIEKIIEEKELPKCISNYSWYIYEGNLELDVLKMDTIPLIITGDFTLHQEFLEIESYSGLMVLGKTKVKSLALNGHSYFFEGIKFEGILASTENGPQRLVFNPEGPIIYNDSHSAEFINILPEKVKVYVDMANNDGHGNIANYLKQDYFEYYDFVTEEEFNEEHDTEDDYSQYYEYENYEEFLASLEIDLELEDISEALKQGEEIFINK